MCVQYYTFIQQRASVLDALCFIMLQKVRDTAAYEYWDQ